MQPGDLPAQFDPYRTETLHVEFQSPSHKTYLIRTFSPDKGKTLIARFSPTEAGTWTYKITGPVARLNDQESTFNTQSSGLPGFFAVANVRHWWTTNKQPHLWLSAQVPLLDLDDAAFSTWLDARKHDGFTHIRGILLTATASHQPFAADGAPNEAYFAALDNRILKAAQKGFGLDLIISDRAFASKGAFDNYSDVDALARYLVSRYGAMDVSWDGIEKFDTLRNGRQLLKRLNEAIQRYDSFNHPRSSDAVASTSPLVRDGWMTHIVEASARPDLAAVEHQFIDRPQIHIAQATAPDAFRHEIWIAYTNGEYLCVPYAALLNPANVKAVEVWHEVVSDTRHWEFEPYFDVDGARAAGLEDVEYLAYAEKPGIVEVNLPKHKYNPVWVNPITGEELPLKDYKGLVFSENTPDNTHDWVLTLPREGHKEMMLRSYRFESVNPPLQEPELDPAKMPFDISAPNGDSIPAAAPPPYAVKLIKRNRGSRTMEYVWWGEIPGSSEGAHLLGVGPEGTLQMPDWFLQPGTAVNVRLLAINANGKAYELDRVYQIAQ